jgi:hypothetical protein
MVKARQVDMPAKKTSSVFTFIGAVCYRICAIIVFDVIMHSINLSSSPMVIVRFMALNVTAVWVQLCYSKIPKIGVYAY